MRESPLSSDAATIRVQFMGRPSDVFGAEQQMAVDPAGEPLGAIRRRLADSLEDGLGAMLGSPAIRGGIDDQIAPDTAWVSPGQTVFFFSPVSGG